MDILDLIQSEQAQAEATSLRHARADANWANTFSSIPPVEQLRATRNLTDQVARAMQRRLELQAQTDRNAQAILYEQTRFTQEKEQESLKYDLLQSKLAREKSDSDAAIIAEQADNRASATLFKIKADDPRYDEKMLKWRADNWRAGDSVSTQVKKTEDLRSQYLTGQQAAALAKQKAEETAARRKTALDIGLVETGVNVDGTHFGPKSEPKPAAPLNADALGLYGKLQDDIGAHLNASKTENGENITAGKPGVGYSKAGELAAKQRQLEILEETYPQLRAKVAPPSATDKQSRAQEALNDPEANEQEKAAARRILGL